MAVLIKLKMLEKVDFLFSKRLHFYFIQKKKKRAFFRRNYKVLFLLKFTTFSNGSKEAMEGILYDVKI
jgi:hypothetical protein